MDSRAAFEAWITEAPYECDIRRFPAAEDDSSWSGQYVVYDVQLAWEAWQEGASKAEADAGYAWQNARTIDKARMEQEQRIARAIEVLAPIVDAPIPERHLDAYLLGVLRGTLVSLRGAP